MSDVVEGLGDSPEIAALLRDKPAFWEHRLTGLLLEPGLRRAHERYEELRLARMGGAVFLGGAACANFLAEKFDQYTQWTASIRQILESDLPKAWGPSGAPGDGEAIKRACRRLLVAADAAAEWERSLASVVPDSDWKGVLDGLRGATENAVVSLWSASRQLLKVEESVAAGERISLDVDLGLPALEKIQAELDAMHDAARQREKDARKVAWKIGWNVALIAFLFKSC